MECLQIDMEITVLAIPSEGANLAEGQNPRKITQRTQKIPSMCQKILGGSSPHVAVKSVTSATMMIADL
jgi:hypothetical protein